MIKVFNKIICLKTVQVDKKSFRFVINNQPSFNIYDSHEQAEDMGIFTIYKMIIILAKQIEKRYPDICEKEKLDHSLNHHCLSE